MQDIVAYFFAFLNSSFFSSLIYLTYLIWEPFHLTLSGCVYLQNTSTTIIYIILHYIFVGWHFIFLFHSLLCYNSVHGILHFSAVFLVRSFHPIGDLSSLFFASVLASYIFYTKLSSFVHRYPNYMLILLYRLQTIISHSLILHMLYIFLLHRLTGPKTIGGLHKMLF